MDLDMDLDMDLNGDPAKDLNTTSKKKCAFCFKKGIPLPHSHTVRDFTKSDHPVICPLLLANACTYCKKKGHTKNYCPILKNPIKISVPSLNKRSAEGCLNENSNKVLKINMVSAALGGMDID